ncbi:hypothetical protein LTR36_006199 [Oleoguttula mirabilis]|uniref:Autophagy-related protein 2 n=1 Tax=Oleoguttula mirabilis TaxID=1507867 RepID=A0AAV9JCK7_9PEZI|nr:hypothetical protein LTR36_006199 [Oleoguttula mirabilis]
MAWWQKKLLHYALSRTGLLDDQAIDPKNLDITLGRKNVVELKDVGLNIKRISKLAQLPPNLRVETARVLSLRLTVPADIYQSSIVAEVDGVELTVRLDEAAEDGASKTKGRMTTPGNAKSPQHRKAHRRIRSPPPYEPGGLLKSDGDVHIPTAHDLARSFLLDEPAQERRALEASLAATYKGVEESIVSESSEGDDVGVGAAVGLPSFLANFLQGIVDRLKVQIKNVDVRVETEVSGDGQDSVPVTLRLRVGAAGLEQLGMSTDEGACVHGWNVKLQDVTIDLLSDDIVFSELSEVPLHASPTDSRQPGRSPPFSDAASSPVARPTTSTTQLSGHSAENYAASVQSPVPIHTLHASVGTVDADRFADAQGDGDLHSALPEMSDLDIKPGDDNISWGSRRSKTSAPAEDLWNSMASEDDLPDSLLLERAATPKAQSSRGDSPAATRSRRAVSPYDRAFQSPGSWPRPNDSPERNRLQQGLGSWPMVEQSPHSKFQAFAPGPTSEQDDPMDNKRAALVAPKLDARAPVSREYPATLPTPTEDQPEDMAQSRFYSHEEAESLYMSAMTQSPRMHVPGGWGSEAPQSERSVSPDVSRHVRSDDSEACVATHHRDAETMSRNATPRAPSPVSNRTPPARTHLIAKRFLFVDQAEVLLPAGKDERTPDTSAAPNNQRRPGNAAPRGMPGTFSAYADLAASQRRGASSAVGEARSILWSSPVSDASPGQDANLRVSLGVVSGTIDLACCRLLYALASSISQSLKQADKPNSTLEAQVSDAEASASALHVCLAVGKLHLSLSEHLPSRPVISTDTGLIAVVCEQLSVNTSPGSVDLGVGRLRVLLSGSELLAFDRNAKLSSSIMLTEGTPDIAITIRTNKTTVHKQLVTEIAIETLPIKLELDLGTVDDTLGSFGGLTGVLDLSNSILSEGGLLASPTSANRPSKGVRFQDDAESGSAAGPELKLNARLGGVDVTLRGEACAVNLRTTTLKAVHRQQGTVATVEHVVLTGPYEAADVGAPLSVDLATVRVEYLLSPQDKDLERLLSLLIPSKDKYDNDDDILIDTLLRQRRKGALARASVGDVKVKLADFDCVQTLMGLSGELSKFSAMTKYLPEDERPGLLTLMRVKTFEAQLPVNDRFGNMQVLCHDFHCAHVGLPALLTLSVGYLRASRLGYGDLVHPLIPLVGVENLPMLMARMLGDEIEPTAKVKLYNVCLEYSVPTILALTGMDIGAAPEEVVAGLAQSIAQFARQPDHGGFGESAPPSDTSPNSAKRTNIDLLVHDSALGLTPEKLSAKALLVLTDGRLSTSVPPESTLTASMELHKAAIFVTDSVSIAEADIAAPGRGFPNNSTTNVRLAAALSKQGYASVGSIMAAKIAARVEEPVDGQSKAVEVDVWNELLLLETCADSTQTLLAILSGLAPPTPPSKQPKYLTEPMTIEDMMASFTGEPEAKPQAPPEMLFDVEEEPDDDPDMLLDAPTLGFETDNLMMESEMASSLYGPVSGMLGGLDQPDDDDADASEFRETVESLLEEDPFEMPLSPTDMGMGDSALLKDLAKQCKPAVGEKPIDLGSYEIEDLGFDALAAGQQALGSGNRFNAPAANRSSLLSASTTQPLPFKLRLRDIHVIWNIHDGYDWQRTRDGITHVVEQVEARAEERNVRRRQSLQDHADEESVVGDVLFNSIYIGVPASHDAQDLRRQINRGIDDLASETESVPLSGMSRPTAYSASGRPMRQKQRRRLKLERSKVHKVAFELKGVSADVLVFPPDSGDVVSSIDVRVRELEVFDNVPTSTWRKFLTRLDSDPATREMSKPMAHIEFSNVRTLENFAAAEIIIHATLLPLRLHVDQDALDFITRFFEFKDDRMPDSGSGEQPFIQRIEVETVDLRLDYKPKRIDYGGLRSGHTSEFVNIVTLDAADIKLKHAIVYGLSGFAPLHKTLNDIWVPDVTRNQLPTVLAGLAPVRSLVNIGNGMRDVVAIPIREYRKDGRIVRSIQKGALHFGKTTTSELARLGAKLAIGTQNLLQGAEGLLAPSSASPSGRPGVRRRVSSEQGWYDTVSEDDDHEQRAISAYANQPLGLFSGLRAARRLLEHDLLTAKDAFIAVQGEVFESNSPGAMAAAVARRAPIVILRPVIGASRAVGTALLGVGNQIDRGNIRKVDNKYKKR